MLKKFKVRNFKNFRDEIIFDLGSTKNYEFQKNIIRNGIIKDAVIYGINASGKSNLGYALLDITSHLVDKAKGDSAVQPYLNLFSQEKIAVFEYEFEIDGHQLIYYYEKTDPRRVLRERVVIDEKTVIYSDQGKAEVYLRGAETLNLSLWDDSISVVRYVAANTILDKQDALSLVFIKFMDFVNRMLWFSSTEGSNYIGFSNVGGTVDEAIIDFGGVQELQDFLEEMDIHYQLNQVIGDDGKKSIQCLFGDKKVPLGNLCSSGTRSAVFFFLWYLQIKKLSFVYIDEFDAFYHYEMAERMLRKLIAADTQVIVTSHNTDLITNELLRPDCYFELRGNTLRSFADRTTKALRQAHNIQKMYKAGAFNER